MRNDTIAAIATPPGAGGIAILRVSGPKAQAIAQSLFVRAEWESHRMYYGHIAFEGETIDEAMVVLMRAPRSYTREDVVEFHCHGGEFICQRVFSAALALGARAAQPGEFTRRAFENGRIDLSQAEAAMRLIGATGEAEARAALRQMDGAVSVLIRAARERLLSMLAAVAACTDFPDEIEEAPTVTRLLDEAHALIVELRAACDARAGRLLSHGFDVVIVGRPNVGKSSLLNALMMENLAIVTPEPGTTRDMVRGTLSLSGIRVNLTDTAGLREAVGEAERIGVERARKAIEGADLLLVILDASAPLSKDDQALLDETHGRERLVLLNKSDLPSVLSVPHDLTVSAETGEGISELKERIVVFMRNAQPGSALLTQARHVEAAERAVAALEQMRASLRSGLPVDFAAVDAREALAALSEITGESAEESVVDAVFRDFCVGK